MKRSSRPAVVPLLAAAAFVVGTITIVHAAQPSAPLPEGATRRSDPSSWPNGKVPVAGDKVTIGRDRQVMLDVSPPVLGGLSIDGKLSFADDADLELTTEWIMLHGDLSPKK